MTFLMRIWRCHILCHLETEHLNHYLLYAGEIRSVQIKFAITYIIGDIFEHNKMCGRYGCYSQTTITLLTLFVPNHFKYQYILQHTSKQRISGWPKVLIQDSYHDKDYFKSISPYPIETLSTIYNLVLATSTPSIWLHTSWITTHAQAWSRKTRLQWFPRFHQDWCWRQSQTYIQFIVGIIL